MFLFKIHQYSQSYVRFLHIFCFIFFQYPVGPSSRSINVLPSGQVPKYLTMTVGNIGRFEQKLREEEDKLGIAPGDRVGINFIYIHYYRVQKRWRHKKLFLDFSVLDTMYRWSMMKNIHSPNLVGIGSWGQNSYEPGQFTLISMGLIRYSCSHISGHHEPIHVKFGVWGFFIMFYWNIVMKMLKCKKENLMMSHFSTL